MTSFGNMFIGGLLMVGLSAMGCSKDEKGEAGGDNASKASGGDNAGPTLDCSSFATKMTECLEPFSVAYSKTEMGSKAGKQTDGTVDHEAAAKRFKMLWGMEGEKLCAGGGAMGSAYVTRDKRWKERFAACDSSAACEAWVPCMSTAIGEMLK